jgi:hypothetical protein
VLSLALTKAEEFCRAETSSIWELDEAAGDSSSASCVTRRAGICAFPSGGNRRRRGGFRARRDG